MILPSTVLRQNSEMYGVRKVKEAFIRAPVYLFSVGNLNPVTHKESR